MELLLRGYPPRARSWLLHEPQEPVVTPTQLASALVVSVQANTPADSWLPPSARSSFHFDSLMMCSGEEGKYALGCVDGYNMPAYQKFGLGVPVQSHFCAYMDDDRPTMAASMLFSSGCIAFTHNRLADQILGRTKELHVFHRDTPWIVWQPHKAYSVVRCKYCGARGSVCECQSTLQQPSAAESSVHIRALRRSCEGSGTSAWVLVREFIREIVSLNGVATIRSDDSRMNTSVEFTSSVEGPVFDSRRRLFVQSLLGSMGLIRVPKAHNGVLTVSHGSSRRLTHTDSHAGDSPLLEAHSTSGGEAHTSCSGGAQPRCDVCGACFSRRHDLFRHVRTVHLKEKKFECEVCGRYFSLRQHVLAHKREVHEKRRDVRCEICDMAFSAVYKLRRHIRSVHLKEKPYTCELCGRSYFQGNDLKRHLHTVHSDEAEALAPSAIVAVEAAQQSVAPELSVGAPQQSVQ